ncbi:single-stranded DNA-binding protein [Reyranella sp. CPCC 100927]|uniref:single-stranded DNA-binding protein n=1 Tax=Reyranella sp. CPCC 100927 TaxID=2599616 RepID=UPI0011B4E0E7|nr:single-stranded DNA-binding protein [Reyranella sp. CPCC 100927]TWS95111.1 single-stranded DNA-binding protein [Reyranella sp. CPCC 100927]
MINEAEFRILGRVGHVTTVGATTRVSICANYRVQQRDGSYVDQPHWNTVTVLPENVQAYIMQHVNDGDLVLVTGRLCEGSYEDGETRYTVDLIATQFCKLASKRSADCAAAHQPSPERQAPECSIGRARQLQMA